MTILRRLLVLMVISLVLTLPIASADDSGAQVHDPENDLMFTHFPQVYVNVTKNASFNVSYVGMLLFTSTGMYFSYFPNEVWKIDRVSNNSLTYTSNIHFNLINSDKLGLFVNEFNLTNIPMNHMPMGETGDMAESIGATVSVSMVKAYLHDPINTTNNTSSLTGFKMTFSFHSLQIKGSGDLLLIQQLGAKVHNEFEQYHLLAKFISGTSHGNDTTMGITGSSYNAYYWWNDSYLLNGNGATFSSYTATDGNIDTVVFKFAYNNSLESIVQDPYFSVPQVNLFNNPIIQKDIQNATTFIMLHLELLSAGLVTGIALLGISYGSYRRRRF